MVWNDPLWSRMYGNVLFVSRPVTARCVGERSGFMMLSELVH